MSKTIASDKAAESIATMVTEWVDGGIKMGTDWRPGLASVIQLRLNRIDTQAELAALREELDESDAVVTKVSELLAGVAVAVRGPELALRRHSYHDLPERVSDLQQRLADAERRMSHAEQWSATLERAIFRALDDSSEDAETGVIEIMRCDYEALAILIGEPVDAALNKPEEAKS